MGSVGGGGGGGESGVRTCKTFKGTSNYLGEFQNPFIYVLGVFIE